MEVLVNGHFMLGSNYVVTGIISRFMAKFEPFFLPSFFNLPPSNCDEKNFTAPFIIISFTYRCTEQFYLQLHKGYIDTLYSALYYIEGKDT